MESVITSGGTVRSNLKLEEEIASCPSGQAGLLRNDEKTKGNRLTMNEQKILILSFLILTIKNERKITIRL